jgi:hypothetical protein
LSNGEFKKQNPAFLLRSEFGRVSGSVSLKVLAHDVHFLRQKIVDRRHVVTPDDFNSRTMEKLQ